MRKMILAVSALLLGLGFTSLTALANSVPGVQFSGDLNGVTVLTAAGTANATECYQGICSPGSITLSYAGGQASVSTQGSSSLGGFGTTALGSVTFFFVVEGNYNGVVPLVATGVSNLSVSGLANTPDYGANLTATFIASSNYFAGGELNACVTTAAVTCGSYPTHFANGGMIDFNMLSYEADTNPGIVSVQLQGYSYDGSYMGTVDPMITFAPSFLATAEADGLSIVYSPGPVASATPEPSTLLLLGSGLTTFGFIRRKFARV